MVLRLVVQKQIRNLLVLYDTRQYHKKNIPIIFLCPLLTQEKNGALICPLSIFPTVLYGKYLGT